MTSVYISTVYSALRPVFVQEIFSFRNISQSCGRRENDDWKESIGI